MTKGIQPCQGLAYKIPFVAPQRRGKTQGFRTYFFHHAAQCVRRAHFQKVAHAMPVPQGFYALYPAHTVFVQIHYVATYLRLDIRVRTGRNTAEHGSFRGMHVQAHEPSVIKIPEDTHARMVKG